MEFILLNDALDERVERIYNSYLTSFPPEERRNRSQFQRLFQTDAVSVTGIFNKQSFVGYAIFWNLTGFNFLEHFEIFPEFRNQNLGSKFLQNIGKTQPRIILESEPGELNEMAARRIKFYLRNAYHILIKNYLQPAYSSEKQALEMVLMANYHPESPEQVVKDIYEQVYGCRL